MKEWILKMTMKIMKKITPLYIKKGELNNQLKSKEKIIVIFGHPACCGCQSITLKFPKLFIKSWFKWYTARFCNVKEHPIDAKNLWIIETPTLLLKRNGEITLYTGEDKIVNMIKEI